MQEYALYKGDVLLEIGTAKEIAEKLGIKKTSVYFYGTPACRKRNKNNARILIKITDDE